MNTESNGSGFQIKRARRSHARLRMALAAVSGAGKTMGALRMAKGLVQRLIDMGVLEGNLEGKICLIDSERKSAQLYADICPFDTIELEPPYSVDRYQQAISTVERAGYAICVIDQISHAWSGPGGQLEFVDALKARGGNQMSPWAKVTPIQQEFYDRMLRSPMHIIVTMRCKSEYVIQEVQDGNRIKKVPVKIGLSPVQRDGIEYEFTTCLDIDLESHMATASKDRTRLFMDKQTFIDESVGERLADWLQSGEAIKLMDAPKPEAGATATAGASATQQGGAEPSEAKQKGEALHKLDSGVEDLILSFLECSTLPDLAGQFDKGQKFVRGFKDTLGAEAVLPFLTKLTTAKDKRKGDLQASPKTILIDQKGVTIGEISAPHQSGETVELNGSSYLVGALTSKSELASVFYATKKEAPAPSGDLLAGSGKLDPQEVADLANFAIDSGLTDAETLRILGVKDIADVPKVELESAKQKVTKAATEKAKAPVKQKRTRAAAQA